MNSRRARTILKQARKNARTGKVAIGAEYDRLKKKYYTDKRAQRVRAPCVEAKTKSA